MYSECADLLGGVLNVFLIRIEVYFKTVAQEEEIEVTHTHVCMHSKYIIPAMYYVLRCTVYTVCLMWVGSVCGWCVCV